MSFIGSVAHASPTAGIKRGREEDGETPWQSEAPFGKRSRPTLAGHDSVINTPTQTASAHPNYESDDQSSMVSEPGSPQEMISSGDDDMEMDDVASDSQSPDEYHHLPRAPQPASPWARRAQNKSSGHRVATPFAHANTGRVSANAITIRTGYKQHVRDRHPQEIFSSDGHLEVPSPIDEDEVPTPPSAADVAGSQLSTLSVNDMEIETAAALPSIAIDPARNFHGGGVSGSRAVSMEPENEGMASGFSLRKQRQRSGAQSNGSASPARLSAAQLEDAGADGGMAKRGLSIGYRADCDKCRMRVPGHMNHFVS
ncbi:hypothetical protein EJ03DRAFT_327225 [Teratosphaeria nubilosa]|uniref:Uncharacterized protein n=1 Tax=Teratosphaeria nubilosa TaxID=161662 RepID=A0A6G1LAF6_9PEZI|nr:hypothetical protein EJ03DRAFT_327225 [Teratosphaeria nubilosa]